MRQFLLLVYDCMAKRQRFEKKVMSFNAVFLQEEDGGYSVSVPLLPGCFSEGDTFEEAKQNITEAIELYLEGEGPEVFTEQRSMKEFMAPVEVYGR